MLCFRTEAQAKTAANHKLACLQVDVLQYTVNFVLQGTVLEEIDLNAELTMSMHCSEKIVSHFNVFGASLVRTKEKRAGMVPFYFSVSNNLGDRHFGQVVGSTKHHSTPSSVLVELDQC